jgi:hypothetical protein
MKSPFEKLPRVLVSLGLGFVLTSAALSVGCKRAQELCEQHYGATNFPAARISRGCQLQLEAPSSNGRVSACRMGAELAGPRGQNIQEAERLCGACFSLDDIETNDPQSFDLAAQTEALYTACRTGARGYLTAVQARTSAGDSAADCMETRLPGGRISCLQ